MFSEPKSTFSEGVLPEGGPTEGGPSHGHPDDLHGGLTKTPGTMENARISSKVTLPREGVQRKVFFQKKLDPIPKNLTKSKVFGTKKYVFGRGLT